MFPMQNLQKRVSNVIIEPLKDLELGAVWIQIPSAANQLQQLISQTPRIRQDSGEKYDQ